MIDQKLNLAYLAPEIPGLSSTFVYNEIFALQDQGYSVETFSVHRASGFSGDERLSALEGKTSYLYEQTAMQLIASNFSSLAARPLNYVKTFLVAMTDSLKLLRQPRIAAGQMYRFFVASGLAQSLAKKQIDHLHIHFAHTPTDIGMYASQIAGITYSVTAHANDLFERGWLLPAKVARSKFFATISNFNIQWLQARGANKQKLTVVRCGVHSQQFQRRASKRKSSPVIFGLLGRLVEKKGVHVLIDACALLAKNSDDFLVQIVGDGPMAAELKQQVKRVGLEHKIQFLGAKPHAEVDPWLATLDYFVLPCVKDKQGDMDGIPVALMEAMLKGVPVISTDLSGLPELVMQGKTGLSAQNNNVEHLSEILLQALRESDTDTEQRISQAEALVEREFDLTTNAKRLGEKFSAP